jgi:Contractile injection system tube protein
MPTLKKATLQEIKADASAAAVPGTEIEVQFNPASLKLELANKIEGGDTRGRQNRQYLGKTSTTLSFDLHFDTADQGTTDEPISVRTLTAAVERFVLPKGQGNTKQAPPKARFHWDELVIDGIIESVSIDFDFFAANGTPLRAKMGVSIREQDAKYQLLQAGPGANQGGNATPPGASGTGPGSTVGGTSDRSAEALAGESAADFAARMGLDPAAWRGIAARLGSSSSLSLQAGVSIDFSSSLSAGAGIGIAAGVEAGAGVSLDASFGLDANASMGIGAALPGDLSVGLALSAAGGVGSAIEAVSIVQSQKAASDARRSFGSAVPPSPRVVPAVNPAAGATSIGAASISNSRASEIMTTTSDAPPPSITVRPSMPEQPRTPLQKSGIAPVIAQVSTPSAPPPLADPRAATFGFGVPLRPRVGSAADLRASASAGRIPLRPCSRVADVLSSNDPSAPPWKQLPLGSVRDASDSFQAHRYPGRSCGCSGRCNHGADAWR